MPTAPPRSRGFTLVELTIAIAIVAILAAIAMPSYSAYIRRTRVVPALQSLSAFMVRMEQRHQNLGNYGSGSACALAPPPNKDDFTYSCVLTSAGQGFTATATGSGPVAGYVYTIDQNGTRATTAHPKGAPVGNCWSLRGGSCDA